MILCKQDLEDAVSDFEDGILDPAFDDDDDDSFMSDEDYDDDDDDDAFFSGLMGVIRHSAGY